VGKAYMRTVYASVFDVRPQLSETPNDCFRNLSKILIEWVEQGYLRKWNVIFLPINDNNANTFSPLPDHNVQINQEQADNCELISIEWSHPDDKDSRTQWNTACNLAQIDNNIQLSIAVRLSSLASIIKPLSFTIGRPRIVDNILNAATCFVGNQCVPMRATKCEAADIEQFVEIELLSGDRVLPIVLVSPDIWTNQPVVDSESLQRSLLGFAKVVTLEDKWAAFALTDCVGKQLSCFNGAVRLYWPGLQIESKPFDHPLYLADSIRSYAQNSQPLERHLFRLLVGISGFRFSDAQVVRNARIKIEKQKQQHIQERLSELNASGNDLREIEAALYNAWSEIEQLKQERDQAKEQVSELEKELEGQKAAWATVQQSYSNYQAIPDGGSQDNDSVLKTVSDVVIKAKQEFSANLLFLDSVIESAANSPYQQPDRVYQLFLALNELVGRWKKDGRLKESWHTALKQKGFEYKEKISVTTLGKYADDYSFIYEGQKLIFENHITIGAKQADTCLSVHWRRDDQKKVLVIGSCGRHGTNTSS
jgi:hypothetical protein